MYSKEFDSLEVYTTYFLGADTFGLANKKQHCLSADHHAVHKELRVSK